MRLLTCVGASDEAVKCVGKEHCPLHCSIWPVAHPISAMSDRTCRVNGIPRSCCWTPFLEVSADCGHRTGGVEGWKTVGGMKDDGSKIDRKENYSCGVQQVTA